jgi:hypothetical protein
LPPVAFRDVRPPNRARAIPPFTERVSQFTQERLNALLLDLDERLPVDPGSPFVAAHSMPRLQQNVTPPDPVVQRVEPSLPIALGRCEKPTLELSHFVDGVIGSLHDHALTLTSTRTA